jgi:hypothetical protein
LCYSLTIKKKERKKEKEERMVWKFHGVEVFFDLNLTKEKFIPAKNYLTLT